MKLTLTGDSNNVDMPMTDAQVNHLRRLLAWLRVEYMLDDHMQAGYIRGLESAVKNGVATSEKAGDILLEKAERINSVPAYIRQAIKMLTKSVREHDQRTGVVEQ